MPPAPWNLRKDTTSASPQHAIIPTPDQEIEDSLLASAKLTVQQRILAQTQAKLGTRAAERLERFMSYAEGWDEGQGQPINLASLLAFERFLAIADLSGLSVALFMTVDGHVVINWLDSADKLIEIEFQPDALTCFAEADDSEKTVLIEEGAIKAYLAAYD